MSGRDVRDGSPDPMMALRLLLRVGSVLLITAFAAVALPTGTMVEIHRWLGLGEMPTTPLVEYLTRSLSLFYGFHGVLLLLVSRDLVRFRPIVVYLGVINVVGGAVLFAIDLGAGLPAWWTWSEGPPLMVVGIAILYLVRNVPQNRSSSSSVDPSGRTSS